MVIVKNNVRYFLLGILAWTALLVCSGVWNVYMIRANTQRVVQNVGEAFFQEILLTRAWNAQYGGVYVPVTPETQPNPYLNVPDRDVVTTTGVYLTKINPAYMTRQIAELARKENDVIYHITSLKPIRPQNAADAWETRILQQFETDRRPQLEWLPPANVYRYMAPLRVDRTCLPCHAQQGYQEGDVRGGISVTMPAQAYRDNARAEELAVSGVHLLFWCLGSVGLGVFGQSRTQQLRTLHQKNAELQHEIDERKQTEVALMQAKAEAETAHRLKSEFLANVSHEVRTPMNAILGFTDILAEKLDQPQYQHYLANIRSSGKALLNLLSDLLDLSKFEAEQSGLHLEPVYFDQLLGEIRDLFWPEIEAKNLAFQLDIPPTLPQAVCADRIRLKQLLINLVSNAIKFTAQGTITVTMGSETLRMSPDAPVNLSIAVADTGIGIPPDQYDAIFETFSHHESAQRRKYGGVGIGLAMAKRLAELMHGTLTVQSTVGRGSVFQVWLPNMQVVEAGPLARPTTDRSTVTVPAVNATGLIVTPLNVPAAARDQLPALIQKFETQFWPQCQELRDLMIMHDIRTFAQQVQQLGEECHVPAVSQYGQHLLAAAAAYDVTSVEKDLPMFAQLLTELKHCQAGLNEV
jgi:two-component system, sensor histidine kinase and response regulator